VPRVSSPEGWMPENTRVPMGGDGRAAGPGQPTWFR
jgi:hypothetical protein